MPATDRGLCDLFKEESTGEFIESLASANELTVIAGAGTSIEAGLPDWSALVRRLLQEVGAKEHLSPQESEALADWTIQRDGLVSAAAVAEASLGDRFEASLHTALYSLQLTPPPGPTALAIADLMGSFSPARCDIATTNYDLVLEAACQAQLGRRPVEAVAATNRSDYRVLHLHGILRPRGTTRGQVILSERHYHEMQDDDAWQQRYLGNRFANSACLFVGASLTDPNLLRYLYRERDHDGHYTVFVRQQDADVYDDTPQGVAQARETTSERRWLTAGVKPIHADFFSQSAQLINEVTHARDRAARGRVYLPLPDRLRRWRNRLNGDLLRRSQPHFRSVQDNLQQGMERLAAGMRSELRAAGSRPRPDEKLQLSLWVYDPGTETLTNWASSDRVWRDSATMDPLSVDWRSDFVSVQAFCTGSLVSQSTTEYAATRWNHVIGAPLYLHSLRFGRLPVGAVTLASSFAESESALARGLPTVRRSVVPQIANALTELLRPTDVTWAA